MDNICQIIEETHILDLFTNGKLTIIAVTSGNNRDKMQEIKSEFKKISTKNKNVNFIYINTNKFK